MRADSSKIEARRNNRPEAAASHPGAEVGVTYGRRADPEPKDRDSDEDADAVPHG